MRRVSSLTSVPSYKDANSIRPEPQPYFNLTSLEAHSPIIGPLKVRASTYEFVEEGHTNIQAILLENY